MIRELPVKLFDRVKRHLDASNFKYHIEDGEFYLTEQFDFPCWVIVNEEEKYIFIKMRKKIKTRRIEDNKKVLLLVNDMNKTFRPNCFYFDDEHIYGECYQYLELSGYKDTITGLIELCVLSFMSAIDANDQYQLIAKEEAKHDEARSCAI